MASIATPADRSAQLRVTHKATAELGAIVHNETLYVCIFPYISTSTNPTRCSWDRRMPVSRVLLSDALPPDVGNSYCDMQLWMRVCCPRIKRGSNANRSPSPLGLSGNTGHTGSIIRTYYRYYVYR